MYPTGSKPQSVDVGDFNNDARMDIIVANSLSNDISILLGYGNGSFATQIRHSTGSQSWSLAIGYFNNDTELDVVVVNNAEEYVSILFGCPNEVFVHHVTLSNRIGSQPRSFVIGDFNNDNSMDIGIANSGSHTIGILLGYGNLSFASEKLYSTGSYSSPYAVAMGDFNNDAQLDIVTANYGRDNIGIFLGYGNGSFSNQTTYLTGSYPYFVAVHDFDNDCKLDVIVANYGSSNLIVFIGYHHGTFAKMISIQLEYRSGPFSVVVGDFNNDRKADVAVVNDGTDNVQLFLQTC